MYTVFKALSSDFAGKCVKQGGAELLQRLVERAELRRAVEEDHTLCVQSGWSLSRGGCQNRWSASTTATQ